MRMRPLVINVVLGVVVVAALVGGVLLLHPFGTGAAAASADTTQLTGTVQQGVVAKTISAAGSLAPSQETAASFAVSGTITSVGVVVGQTVTAGQVLGTIDATPLKKAQQTASLQLQNAKAQLASAQTSAAASSPQGGSSASQIADARSQVTTAQSAYDDATAAIAEATLTAPVGGLVVAVNGTVGSGTQAGSPVQAVAATGTAPSSNAFVVIADVASLTVTAGIAESDISSISIGQAATVSFPALGTTTAPAKVTAIAPTATAANSQVSYATTVTLDAVPSGLRLGQTAEVSITTATSTSDALYVPTAAITTANGASTVKVVAADGTTRAVAVTLGVVGDVGTQIVSGLRKGETVVIGTVSATQNSAGTGLGTRRFGGFGGGGFGGAGGGGFGGNRTGGAGGTGNAGNAGN